jgi:hypothetical protein
MRVLFFAGSLFAFSYIVRGVWFVSTQRAAKGLKCLAIGFLPPVAFVTLAMLLFPSCAEHDPGLAEWVTLKGKVVNANGHPVEGVNITLRTYFTERGDYSGGQARENVTDSSGTYELTEVHPLSLEMTAGYLVRSNTAVRCVPFFFGEVYASPSFDGNDAEPRLTLPLISENRLKRARRSIRYLGWPGRKENDVWLPRSEGDVIFLPDIRIGNDPSIEENKRAREEAMKQMHKTAVRFGPAGYWDDKGIYRPFP